MKKCFYCFKIFFWRYLLLLALYIILDMKMQYIDFNKPYIIFLRSPIKCTFIFLDLLVGYYISLIIGLSCEQLMVNL